eukprot:TRINITY_DN760_c0_g2_i1.p1 TRINITY_DN760_c0_g2~~TRINITY_DN760_c0_g2_i1.p1  ORF type:complete len:267 (-),score=85.03 TRINITY_DN760_c0_g2_i1:60-860(-)
MRALALAVFAACFVVAFGATCTPTLNKVNYNFNALRNGGQSSGDWFLPSNANQDWDIFVNFCGGVNAAFCGTDCAACQVWDYSNGFACLGKWSTMTWSVVSGKLVAKFPGGAGGRNMKTTFTCVSGGGNGAPKYTNEAPPLEYNFDWSTASACPSTTGGSTTGTVSSSTTGGDTSGDTTTGDTTGSASSGEHKKGKLTGGDIFLIIFFVGFGVYFIVGIIVKKAVFKAEGKDILPNSGFWTGLPGLIKDGFMFIVNKTCRRNYSAV